jgi:hypothetical protein
LQEKSFAEESKNQIKRRREVRVSLKSRVIWNNAELQKTRFDPLNRYAFAWLEALLLEPLTAKPNV